MNNTPNLKLAVLFAAFTCILFPGVVSAKSKNLESRPVEEKKMIKGTFQIDETKAYIFLHANNRQFGVFIKEPNQAEIDAYEEDWIEKFEKAETKYARRLKKWNQLNSTKGGKPGKKPIEPTTENFSIGPIELRNSVSFGPQFVFSKDKTDKENPIFSYMMEVEPGNYVYHGAIFTAPNGAASGVCYCMGSVQFQVKSGEITDLGNFLTNAPAMANGGSDLVGPMFLQKTNPDSKLLRWLKNPIRYGLPESLSSYNHVKADFKPSGKMNNVYRAMVSRMGPVEGLFRYDRDKVVDLKRAAKVEVLEPATEILEVAPAVNQETPEEVAAQQDAN